LPIKSENNCHGSVTRNPKNCSDNHASKAAVSWHNHGSGVATCCAMLVKVHQENKKTINQWRQCWQARQHDSITYDCGDLAATLAAQQLYGNYQQSTNGNSASKQ